MQDTDKTEDFRTAAGVASKGSRLFWSFSPIRLCEATPTGRNVAPITYQKEKAFIKAERSCAVSGLLSLKRITNGKAIEIIPSK